MSTGWLARGATGISEVLVAKLTTWRAPGFSAFVGRPIAPEDEAAIEAIAA